MPRRTAAYLVALAEMDLITDRRLAGIGGRNRRIPSMGSAARASSIWLLPMGDSVFTSITVPVGPSYCRRSCRPLSQCRCMVRTRTQTTPSLEASKTLSSVRRIRSHVSALAQRGRIEHLHEPAVYPGTALNRPQVHT